MSDENRENAHYIKQLENAQKMMCNYIGENKQKITELEKVIIADTVRVAWSVQIANEIAELERKYEGTCKLIIDDIEIIDRIEELEKNQKGCNNTATFKMICNRIGENKDKIAELKEHIDNHSDCIIELRNLIQGNAISDLNHYEANDKEIAELKKLIEAKE